MQGTAGLARIQNVQGPASGTGAPVTTPIVTIPTTAVEIKVLRARRSEISSQISNITDRRNEIASQLRSASPGADRAGLESRLAALDGRIVQLENDLNVTGTALASARGDAAILVDPPRPTDPQQPSAGQTTAMVIIFFLAVLMPLSIAWGRAIVRRTGKHEQQLPSAQITQRLDRMEEGIDAIAIEVERISEGQRFVTRVLGEGTAPQLGAGAAEPIAVPRGEPVHAVRRS
jgi:hypothetical protein